MSTVDIQITGTPEECLTVVALLSHVAPVVVTHDEETHRGAPAPSMRRVHAEIRTRLRDP